jgi:ribosome biogenesis GTPase A
MGRPQRPKAKPSAFQHLQDQLKWVDLIFEVRDARLPKSSRHPQSEQIFGTKPRVIVLGKEDIADSEQSKRWLDSLLAGGQQHAAICLSTKHNRGKEKLIAVALKHTIAKREALQKRGLLPRAMRACVVGMPNVGKSSFINWLIGRKKAPVGDRPGVTKGAQWVRVHPQLELLDTPGILPPAAFAPETKLKLALLNLIPEGLYENEEIAANGIHLLGQMYPRYIENYGIDLTDTKTGLEQIAARRNCIGPGGTLDTRRAANIFLGDIRDGRLGRLTLDLVEGK